MDSDVDSTDQATGACTEMEINQVQHEERVSSAENSPQPDDLPTDEASQHPPMSKRQRKKLEQKLKKQEYLKEKRIQERIRKKQRMKEARALGIDTGPSRKALKHNTMEKSQCKVKVVIDCSFDELMSEKDIKSVVTQINHCYASNRRATDPIQFHITDFHGQLKAIMDGTGHYHNWDVNKHDANYLDVFDKSDIIYLSSDSDNVLNTLLDNKVYIIGGLVDHNHHKGMCLKLAEKNGLNHAQLPIGEYVALESRKTLAVNHVFEILLQYTESRDWKDAFYKVIPRRKVGPQGDQDKVIPHRKVGPQEQQGDEENSKGTSSTLDTDNKDDSDKPETSANLPEGLVSDDDHQKPRPNLSHGEATCTSDLEPTVHCGNVLAGISCDEIPNTNIEPTFDKS